MKFIFKSGFRQVEGEQNIRKKDTVTFVFYAEKVQHSLKCLKDR